MLINNVKQEEWRKIKGGKKVENWKEIKGETNKQKKTKKERKKINKK